MTDIFGVERERRALLGRLLEQDWFEQRLDDVHHPARACPQIVTAAVIPVPHVRIRISSDPARLVVNVVSPINSHGLAYRATSSEIPRSRNTSFARWFVMCARGLSAIQLLRDTR